MIKSVISEKNVKIHFIGIGGIGMSGLAKYCLSAGHEVSGSDTVRSEETRILEKSGAKIYYGHRRGNARGADVVVYTSAITSDNPEFQFAVDNGKVILKRSELLALIEKRHGYSVAVSGCHGKTTVTAMLAHIFKRGGVDLTAFIGGEDRVYGNFIAGKDVLLTEACEFKKNFLDLTPTLAVVLNIDNDHLDCYGSLEELTAAYRAFVSKSLAVINADDKAASSIAGQTSVTYGIKEAAVYKASDIREEDGGVSFTFSEYGAPTAKINLRLSGIYNVYNALAALASARCYGIPVKKAAEALKDFEGVKRRQEILGNVKGAVIEADYAHHPSEIAAVLGGGKNVLAVFQPHTYSRTKLLMKDFVKTFQTRDTVVLPTYAAREAYDVEGSGYALYIELSEAGAHAKYAENKEQLFKFLDGCAEKYDKIIFLGAGDIYSFATEYAKNRFN